MPRHKQPLSLVHLTLRTVAKMIRVVGNNLIETVCTVSPRILNNEAMDMNEEFYDVCWLQELLLTNLPSVYADDVTRYALSAITQIVKETDCMSFLFTWEGDRKCMHIVEDLIECVLSPYIRVMDFLQWPKFMWMVFCKNLHKLTGLEVLKLHSISACDQEMKDFIEQYVCLLKNLVVFTYRGGCSDHIVSKLGDSCGKLQVLDISLSARLSDHSVESILKLKDLRKLDVSCTNLSEEGSFRLLTGLRNLESYACSKLTTPHLMVELCPNLIEVSLSYVTCDLSALGQLKKLKDVSLSRCNCLVTNLTGFLRIKGHELDSLQLSYVWNADISAITCFCTHLKKLSWEVYTFIESSLVASAENTKSHFHSLLHLDITNFSPINIHFQPLNYVNVKVLKIHFFGDICDELVLGVVSKNALKQLVELRLYNCGFLSLRTVRVLLEHCSNLAVLGGLCTWRGISAKELECFRLEMRKNNIDIRFE